MSDPFAGLPQAYLEVLREKGVEVPEPGEAAPEPAPRGSQYQLTSDDPLDPDDDYDPYYHRSSWLV